MRIVKFSREFEDDLNLRNLIAFNTSLFGICSIVNQDHIKVLWHSSLATTWEDVWSGFDAAVCECAVIDLLE
jgi:hypothetical protein